MASFDPSPTWTAGFALAATAARDTAPPMGQLTSALRAELEPLWQHLQSLAPAERRAWVRALAVQFRRSEPALPILESLPPRARALLASSVPKHIGHRWLNEAPPPRMGFRPDPQLQAAIRSAALREAVE